MTPNTIQDSELERENMQQTALRQPALGTKKSIDASTGSTGARSPSWTKVPGTTFNSAFSMANMLPQHHAQQQQQHYSGKRDSFPLDSYLAEVSSFSLQSLPHANKPSSSYNPMLDLASHLPTAAEIAASVHQLDTHNSSNRRSQAHQSGSDLGEYNLGGALSNNNLTGINSPLSSPILGPTSGNFPSFGRGAAAAAGFQLSPSANSHHQSEYLYNQLPGRQYPMQRPVDDPYSATTSSYGRIPTSYLLETRRHSYANLSQRNKRKSSSSFHTVDGGEDSPRAGIKKGRSAKSSQSSSNPTSKYRGVSWKKDRNAWAASIMVRGKHQHLGYFDNEIEAAKAYDTRCELERGPDALLNFPAINNTTDDPAQIKTENQTGPAGDLSPQAGMLKSSDTSVAAAAKSKNPKDNKQPTSRHVKPKAARTSKYRGVIWDKNSRAWRAKLSVNGKLEHIGLFDIEEDAAKAWDLRAVAVRGKRARLNFPAFVAQIEKLGTPYPIHFESQRVRGGLRGYGLTIGGSNLSVPKATAGITHDLSSPSMGQYGSSVNSQHNQLLNMYQFGVRTNQQQQQQQSFNSGSQYTGQSQGSYANAQSLYGGKSQGSGNANNSNSGQHHGMFYPRYFGE